GLLSWEMIRLAFGWDDSLRDIHRKGRFRCLRLHRYQAALLETIEAAGNDSFACGQSGLNRGRLALGQTFLDFSQFDVFVGFDHVYEGAQGTTLNRGQRYQYL